MTEPKFKIFCFSVKLRRRLHKLQNFKALIMPSYAKTSDTIISKARAVVLEVVSSYQQTINELQKHFYPILPIKTHPIYCITIPYQIIWRKGILFMYLTFPGTPSWISSDIIFDRLNDKKFNIILRYHIISYHKSHEITLTQAIKISNTLQFSFLLIWYLSSSEYKIIIFQFCKLSNLAFFSL